MSSESQMQKCKLTGTLYKHIKGYGFTHLGKISALLFFFFLSSVYTPGDDSLQNVNQCQEKKKCKGFGLSSMHVPQNHVLKNHNHRCLLLLGKIPKQLTAAHMTAAGSRANYPQQHKPAGSHQCQPPHRATRGTSSCKNN